MHRNLWFQLPTAFLALTSKCFLSSNSESDTSAITVFYYILDHWAGGDVESGQKVCMSGLKCDWRISSNISELRNSWDQLVGKNEESSTVALYNIHR